MKYLKYQYNIAATIIITLFTFLPLMNSQNTTVHSLSIHMLRYSYIDLHLHNHLLPLNIPFTLQAIEQGPASTLATVVWSTTVQYHNNISSYTFWNYQNTQNIIAVNLLGPTALNISQFVLHIGENTQPLVFTALLDNDQTSGYMLPFNLLNIKQSKVLVVVHNSTPQTQNYNLPPYMSTYWTENKISSAVMPWLPYFSQCDFQSKFIMLNDLILGSHCQSNVFEEVVCSDKEFAFDCILEEYEVSSLSSQYWFNTISKIVYYLHPTRLSPDQLHNLISDQTLTTQLFSTYYSNLVPVRYHRQSSHMVIVNSFQVIIRVDLNYGSKIEIVAADIIGSYESNLPQPQGKVYVKVLYISLWQSFISYNIGIGWYLIFASVVALMLFIPLKISQSYLGRINLAQKFMYFVSPALKGIGYTLMTAGGLVVLTHLISFYTSYSSVIATYDSNYTDQELQDNNKGRYGLAFLFTGVLIIMNGIQQATKVNQTDQLKISLEDDKWHFQTENQMKVKIQFSKKNQTSHRRHLFNGMLVCLITIIMIVISTVESQSLTLALNQLLVFPIATKFCLFMLRRYFINSALFLCPLLVSYQLVPLFRIFKNHDIYELVYLYFAKYVSMFILLFACQLIFDWLAAKILYYRFQNKAAEAIHNVFEKEIIHITEESQYERALSYSIITVSLVTSIFLYPVLALVILLTEQFSQIPHIFMITQPSLIISIFLFFLTIPVQLYSILITIDLLKKHFDLRIEQTIKFNHFKFMREKFKWMNDVFAHSKDIRDQFRLYQKFAFSSQLYFVISLIAFGMMISLMGILTMLTVRYLPFYDPVTVLMFFILWVTVAVLSTAVSFAAVKLKLYERKQTDPIRQQLGKINKYLKVNQTSQYLELDAVKDYFMDFNKTWIIHNLHQIFTKQDFRLNHYELINKYKLYKSNLKRKMIEERKKIQEEKLNQNKMKQNDQLFQDSYRIIRNQKTFQVAGRISIYWYYLAKQNLYLKDIVNKVKKQQIKPICEYCKMDVQLQVLEKKQFHSLVNKYRIQNVGKMFDQNSFLQFYRLNQQFITICLECKQKNLHIEMKINSKNKSSKIVFYWLLMARSRLLHQKALVESDQN